MRTTVSFAILVLTSSVAFGQNNPTVQVVKKAGANIIDIKIGDKLFTSFLYPDTLEKPVLYPVFTSKGTDVTRGFPLNPRPGDPTDHPHHIGIWFNYENLNGLDYWNNSYAIPKEKKNLYGWIKTDKILEAKSGKTGILSYHANWVNQKNEVLVEELTRLEFSKVGGKRIIDRTTTLTANTEANFTDAKDGMLGMRLAHELQIPTTQDQKFTDNKGNVTIVKGGEDKIPNGNYITSEGKSGDAAWSTRAAWCKVYGKMNGDSVAITIIDHPANPNYPTFWHARGYGLFAANPLGEKIFTNGKSAKNLSLKKGESVTFNYRIVVEEGSRVSSAQETNRLAADFARKKPAKR
ncbi:MAG: hypothetical protein K0S09_1847 [Sphingobacteriaceae bacterium]|jgi:hypothetical protein|nr:hypothetical protein [Sphingobacteriaceae bacterium]